ncbi:MAG TPA: HlyD family efflux transporter periplasmic adaptor subunit [Vicinamibacterales bacterium]|jgi:HlyD family secretion protein
MARSRSRWLPALIPVLGILSTCSESGPRDRARVSGQIEATSVEVAAEAGGRLIELKPEEGDRVRRDEVIARFDTRDVELALRRATAEREHAVAQLKLLQAGARPEDIRQASAQMESARAETSAAEAELKSAETDLERFEQLLKSNSGSQKQRDDAATRRDVSRQRVEAARERERAGRENLARVRAGARAEEIQAAQARVAVSDAQIAALQKNLDDATLRAPVDGVVTEKLVQAGEVVAPRTPLLVVVDLDRAWAEVFVDEPDVPRLRLGQAATLYTDAGGPGIPGKVSFISSKAEFTPRNVQTAEERSKLVYRVKIAVDNREGVLKEGMPIEAEILFQPPVASDTRND